MHTPRPGTPAEILAAYLTQTSREGVVDLEALCAEHPQHASELRRLTAHWLQVIDVVDALSSGSSLQSRLEHRLGQGLDPQMSLDDGGSSATPEMLSGEARRKLEAVAPLTRYEARREIARGGMGAILEVWDGDLRRTLAMKVLLSRKSSREGAESMDDAQRLLARFLEEAQVTAQLDHPGILPVHELGIDDRGRIFFTMPLVKGQDLSQILKLVKLGVEGWTVTRAVGVLLKVCEAMAYAHSKRVIHRDLKPANVMVGRFGAVYVMDWGLAKVLGREDHRDLRIRRPDDSTMSVVGSDARAREGSPLVTMDGDIIGTPSYMSPEQARSETDLVGPASDVYSIGSVLYHLCAGHMPYVPKSSKRGSYAVWEALKKGPPSALLKEARDTPDELVAICEKAMARDQADRYADIDEMAEDLRAYLEGRVVRAHSTGAITEFRKWVQRNQALAATAALALFTTFGGLALAFFLQSRSKDELSDTLGELQALWTEYELSTDKIAGMEEESARKIGQLEARAEADRSEAATLRSDLDSSLAKAARQERELELKQSQVDSALIAARNSSYVANINGAAMSLESSNLEEMFRRLEECSRALRGWEWNHLALSQSPALFAVAGGAWDAAWRGNGQILHGTHDGFLVLRDALSGQALGSWKGHAMAVSSVVPCPGTDLYATGSLDGTVRIWDFSGDAGEDPTSVAFSTGERAVGAMVFSHDGSRLITAEGARHRVELVTGRILVERTTDCAIKIWDADTGAAAGSLDCHGEPIRDLALHPDGRRLISASEDSSIGVWDLETLQSLSRLESHVGPVNALALDSAGERLVSAGEDTAILVWDLESERVVDAVGIHSSPVLDVDLAPDGRRLLSASSDGTLHVWDIHSQEELSELRGHEEEVGAALFSPDGTRILSASFKDGLRMWDAYTALASTQLGARDHRLRSLILRQPGAGAPTPIFSLDLDVRDASGPLLIGETVALDPSGSRIARPGRRRQLRRTYSIDVWDAESLTTTITFQGHSGQILALAWSPDGRWLASSSKDQTLVLWDTEGRGNRVLDRDGGADVEALAFSPDGTRLASGSADGRVVIHELGNPRNIGQAAVAFRRRSMFGRHEGAVRALAWHPAGEVLASASADDTIQLFGTSLGQPLHRLQGHNGDVLCLVFNPDGSRLFSGSRDKTVRVWHTDLGLSLLTMAGMRFPVQALAIEQDGRRLITVEASTVPTVRVWDSSLVDVQEMWREREDARQARSLVSALFEEHQSAQAVLRVLAGLTDIEQGVREIALLLAGRLQE